MNDLAAPQPPIGDAPLLDLEGVAAPARARIWSGGVSSLFPGLSTAAVDPSKMVGTIRGATLGEGRVFSILSMPIEVEYTPFPRAGGIYDSFSLVVQLRGSLAVEHLRRQSRLTPGDLCLLDGRSPFSMRVEEGASEILVLQIPRGIALSNQPFIERLASRTLPASEPGAALLRDFLLRTARVISALTATQQSTALGVLMRMLAVPDQAELSVQDLLDRRVRAALSCIGDNLCDPELTAEDVARKQRISRRRLDQLCKRATGSTVAAHIWDRRLQLSEEVLGCAAHASKSVTEVALAVGFKSPSHFSRAFRRRYGMAPQDWRMLRGAAGGPRERH